MVLFLAPATLVYLLFNTSIVMKIVFRGFSLRQVETSQSRIASRTISLKENLVVYYVVGQ